MKHLRLTLISLLTLAACGGSGGDGNDARNVSGTWRGALTQIINACLTASPGTINIIHQVAQNEDAVTLRDENGIEYIGNTVAEEAFSVDSTHSTTVSAVVCTDATNIGYDDISSDTDPTANVDIRINRTCPGRAACMIQYTGTASRTGTGTNPTPGPTATGTVLPSGGCAAMNPNPAAGSYSGDGGCGISTTAMTLQPSAVVLTPFGANGATSFAINSSNSSAASSTRNDLTIKGVPGYSCSMVCSPPGTFTVQCFKEGGTTCVEKF